MTSNVFWHELLGDDFDIVCDAALEAAADPAKLANVSMPSKAQRSCEQDPD
jgi:hypothetical protein